MAETILWKDVQQYFTVVLFVVHFYPVLENLSVWDLALSGLKGLKLTFKRLTTHEKLANANFHLKEPI